MCLAGGALLPTRRRHALTASHRDPGALQERPGRRRRCVCLSPDGTVGPHARSTAAGSEPELEGAAPSGNGRTLRALAHIEDRARDAGAVELRLYVHRDNAMAGSKLLPAIHLYRLLAFENGDAVKRMQLPVAP
jgi:hypothetical protein